MIKFEYRFGVLLFCLQLISCATNSVYSPLLRAEPEIGSELTRAPRTLRLYFDELPDVSQSSLRLVGPNGEHQLRGLCLLYTSPSPRARGGGRMPAGG